MIGLLQRVSEARVTVDGKVVGATGAGLLVLVGIERGDCEADADRLLERVVNYRVFADAAGRMNLSVRETGGGLLLVPQFTLAADTAKGLRPSFTPPHPPNSDVGSSNTLSIPRRRTLARWRPACLAPTCRSHSPTTGL